jgi:hypothetical protein
VIVTLSKDELQFCTALAAQRWLMKFGSTDKPNYAKGKAEGRLEHNLLSDVRSIVSEWAVAKHYNLTWTCPVWPNDVHNQRKDFPDVGTTGEVRTVRTQNAIPFWEKDADKVIYGTKVLSDDYFNQVKLFSPFAAADYMRDEFRDPEINGWRLPLHIVDADTLSL